MGRRQKNRKWQRLAECPSTFLCWKRMAGQRFKLRERRVEGGRGQLMDGVAQQGSEVRRALRELIGHSVLIHFLLLAYSWAWRQSDRVEAGCIFFMS